MVWHGKWWASRLLRLTSQVPQSSAFSHKIGISEYWKWFRITILHIMKTPECWSALPRHTLLASIFAQRRHMMSWLQAVMSWRHDRWNWLYNLGRWHWREQFKLVYGISFLGLSSLIGRLGIYALQFDLSLTYPYISPENIMNPLSIFAIGVSILYVDSETNQSQVIWTLLFKMAPPNGPKMTGSMRT